jgi:hypothetical protein
VVIRHIGLGWQYSHLDKRPPIGETAAALKNTHRQFALSQEYLDMHNSEGKVHWDKYADISAKELLFDGNGEKN